MSMANKSVSRETEEPASVLNALSEGSRQTRTLAECLAVDQARLARATLPDAGAEVFRTFDAAARLGILRRMQVEGATLLARYGLKDGLVRCKSHTSDTVRGWGCFIVGASPDLAAFRNARVCHLMGDEFLWTPEPPQLAGVLPPGTKYIG